MTLIANARMYSVGEQAAADWKQLMAWVLKQAQLEWDVIDYPAPAPLSELWARSDLGLVMMCGLPFSMHDHRPEIIAAPVPVADRYGRRPVYFTDIVIRADSQWQTLEDSFGGILGFTLEDSMSGGVALRHHLAPLRAQRGSRLYRKAEGGLVNARGVIDALIAGRIDVGPLDSYYHELLQSYEPDYASQVRTIATTQAFPIPPLIATAELNPEQLKRLQAALSSTASAPEVAGLMKRLLITGFTVPLASDYDSLATLARQPLPHFEDI
ncbi:phosphate/phosphite/phosphonate ABC transporter substrate-binding protein [Comamonas testosteroni]|nr:PhnD/SsuA/transferrin family substrate-binding protein [Comamonas testosteroni]